MIAKPASVAEDPFKSAKWDEVTAGRDFGESDAPTLALLVQWHAVVQQCIDDMDSASGMVAYQNDMGDLKAPPQLSTMKRASACDYQSKRRCTKTGLPVWKRDGRVITSRSDAASQNKGLPLMPSGAT